MKGKCRTKRKAANVGYTLTGLESLAHLALPMTSGKLEERGTLMFGQVIAIPVISLEHTHIRVGGQRVLP